MRNGIGTPFIKIYNPQNEEIDAKCTEFEYSYSEESDDEATIVFESDEPSLADHPDLQEDKSLTLLWGYLGGKTSSRRIVYIIDTAINFGDKGVSLTIKATDKASYLKNNSKNRILEETSLDKAAEEIAAENGLLVDNQIKNESNILTTGQRTREYNTTQNIDNVSLVRTFFHKTYESYPQANKSDAQLLEELAEKENEGPVKVVGRDDKLIIKNRNLSQDPKRTYIYKGGDGELISFSPSTKNSSTKKEKVEIETGGWDKEAGEYKKKKVDVKDEREAIMGDVVERAWSIDRGRWVEREKTEVQIVQVGLRSTRPTLFDKTLQKATILLHGGVDPNKREQIGKDEWVGFDTYKGPKESEQLTVRDKEGNLKITTQTSAGDVVTRLPVREYIPPANLILNTTAEDGNEAENEASNKRSEEQLKSVTARVEVLGDPTLESEQVITILNVSNKFSGNYYIETITHKLGPDQPYLCSMRLLKNALGKTGGEADNKIDAEDLGKEKNKKVATNSKEEPKIKVRNESNN